MPYSVKGEGNAEPQIRERRVTEMGPALPIALHAANGWNRRRGDSAFHNAHASLGVAGHWAGLAGTMAPIVIGEFITDPTKRWRTVRLAVVGTAAAVAYEALHIISELRRRKEQETKLPSARAGPVETNCPLRAAYF